MNPSDDGDRADDPRRQARPMTGPGAVSERLLPARSSDGPNPSAAVGLGLAVGLAAGALFGLEMNQLAVGLGIGIGMGIALGAAFIMAVGTE